MSEAQIICVTNAPSDPSLTGSSLSPPNTDLVSKDRPKRAEVNFISHDIKMLNASDLSADDQRTMKQIGGTVRLTAVG